MTFEVRLGKCACIQAYSRIQSHRQDCPALPIRVACSIGGETWEESDVEAFPVRVGDGRAGGIPWDSDAQERAAHAACEERWALMKALVLGNDLALARPALDSLKLAALMQQRDAVFAALADMARAEEALLHAQYDVDKHQLTGELPDPDHRSWADNRPSAARLMRYISHLISQVGAL